MTNEQLLIYLYGIYPEGEFTRLYTALIIILVFASMIWVMFKIGPEEEKINNITLPKFIKRSFIALSILLFLSNLVPDKKYFVAMVAAPYLKKSYIDNNGTLNKLDKILDLSLDKDLKTKGEIK